jgi:hypothetical protein
MQIINYPGSICWGIYKIINLSPPVFTIIWPLVFGILTLFLVVTTTIKILFTAKVAALKNFKWLFSPVTYILLLCSGVFVLRIPGLVLPVLNPDENQWIVNAATWLNGATMWKSLSGATSGPLVFIPLNIMVFFGGLNYASIRLFGLLVCILPSIYLLWKMLNFLYGEAAARLSVIPLFIFFAAENSNDFISYNSEHVPIVLTAIAAYLFFRFTKFDFHPLKKLFFLGLILGLFPYAKLQAMPIGLCFGLLTIFEIVTRSLAGKKKATYLVTFCFAVLIPTSLVVIYLTDHNCWRNFLDDYLLQNVRYANLQVDIFFARANGMAKWDIPLSLIRRFTPFVFLTPLLTIALICFSRLERMFIRINFGNKHNVYQMLLVLSAYISVAAPGYWFLHYVLLLVIPLTLFSGGIMGNLLNSETRGKINGLAFTYCIPSIIYALSVCCNPVAGIEFVSANKGYNLSEVSEAIKKYTRPNERMSIWGWAEYYYVETGLVQGNSYSNPFYAMISNDQASNPQLSRYVSELELNKPPIFLDAVNQYAFVFNDTQKYRHENYPALNNFIAANYRQVAEFGGGRIYVINSRLKEMGITNL